MRQYMTKDNHMYIFLKLVLEKKKQTLKVKNTKHMLMLTRFDIDILENIWEFNRKEWTKVSCFKQ